MTTYNYTRLWFDDLIDSIEDGIGFAKLMYQMDCSTEEEYNNEIKILLEREIDALLRDGDASIGLHEILSCDDQIGNK